MIDHGDHLKRTVCDVCLRPFQKDRFIPIPPICRQCREDTEAAMRADS